MIVGEPKWVFSLRGGGGSSIIDVNPNEYYTWGFCNLVVNLGMRIGPISCLSALSGNTLTSVGKVR